jgi:hypothetical protein
MADVEIEVKSFELRVQLGWVCPKCQSVHAPFVAGCSHCDANKYPRVQPWLLTAVKKEIDKASDTEHQHMHSCEFTTAHVVALYKAALPKE